MRDINETKCLNRDTTRLPVSAWARQKQAPEMAWMLIQIEEMHLERLRQEHEFAWRVERGGLEYCVLLSK